MTPEISLRHAWVEINLAAIEYNTRRLCEIIGRNVELMAMVKANAYGHGAIEVARVALRAGARWLGVFNVGEGIELREAGLDAPILVLGPTPPRWARAGVAHNLALNVFAMESADAISAAARALNARARVHIKIDTGLTRLGVLPDAAREFVRAVRALPNVEIEGVLTHFAVSDEPDALGMAGWGRVYTQAQLAQFNAAVDGLARDGVRARYLHAANSPAALKLPAARFNLVRSGILLYGLDPSPDVPAPRDFRRALVFKTEIAIVKEIPVGTYVGYGCTFRAARATRLAVILVGYADGFRRQPRDYGVVLVRGQRAPLVGRVAMDQAFVDVTDVAGAGAGDEVVLIGEQGAEEIRAEEVAQRLGTNNYETVTTISARVERRYMR